jgi:thiamine biosynthesis lipoprotein
VISSELFRFPFQALGGANEVQICAEDRLFAESIANAVIEQVKAIEQKFSRYIPESIVSIINSSAGKDAVKVDEETAALLDYAQACYEQSDGLFDITSGVLRRVWDFKSGKVPTQSHLNEVLPLIGWSKVKWAKPYISLSIPGMEIDFGGFGKEYATDRAAALLLEAEVEHSLVNLGGDLRVIGNRPDLKPWSIGIVHPRQLGGVIASVDISAGALATSGDYERFFELDGKRYCHILNPKTGMPVQSFQSVSVLADSCLIAGSASTIAMLFGEKRGAKFLKHLGLKYVLVGSDGRVSHQI